MQFNLGIGGIVIGILFFLLFLRDCLICSRDGIKLSLVLSLVS